jgi:mannitol/fructose-specific phosphotransferase system IIA component (Ntr-type)
MDSLLDALQEGRLIELPDNDKMDALQFLAHIIEAIPSLPAGTDVAGLILAKEQTSQTSLGMGWACPDARVPFEEDLICVVGWSPQGINYGAPDGIPVSIIVMYLVPENQRNHYLREVSLLAKALAVYPGVEKLRTVRELNEIRDHLLDLISSTKETVGPDSRARMIRLQARPTLASLPPRDLSNLIVEPVTLVGAPGIKPIVLTQNAGLAKSLDAAVGLLEKIEAEGVFQAGVWRVAKRGKVEYQHNRFTYDCLAITTSGNQRNIYFDQHSH